jgi:hypothetical protein
MMGDADLTSFGGTGIMCLTSQGQVHKDTYHPSTVATNAIMIDTENIIFLLVHVAYVYFKQRMRLMLDLKKLFKILWGSHAPSQEASRGDLVKASTMSTLEGWDMLTLLT